MGSIREVLAANLKEYRRRNGFSQDKLAELADISSQYLATVETCRKFPTPEMLERLAAVLEIEPHQLFSVAAAPEEALERLHQAIVTDIRQEIAGLKQVVREAIQETLTGKCADEPEGQ